MRKKFWKKLFCALLAVTMAVVSALPASAAVSFERDNPFRDVRADKWFASAVVYCYANGILKGTSTTAFAPLKTVARSEVAQALYNRESKPAVDVSKNRFTDVPQSQWYAEAVIWATENGVVNGTGNNTFAPSKNVTRQDVCTMVYRYYKEYLHQDAPLASEVEMAKFSDWDRVSGYAREAVRWAIRSGFMNGTSKTALSPTGTASRAELAQFLMNLDKIFGKDVTVEMPTAPLSRVEQLVKYIQTNGTPDMDGDLCISYEYTYEGFLATAEVLVQDQGDTLMLWQRNEYDSDSADTAMMDDVAFWYYLDTKSSSEIQYYVVIGEDEETYQAEIIPASYRENTYLQFVNTDTGEAPDDTLDELMQTVVQEAFLHWQDILQEIGFSLADIGFLQY